MPSVLRIVVWWSSAVLCLVTCMPVSRETSKDLAGDYNVITDWTEHYLKLYQDEAREDWQTLFEDYGDDSELKEYYDYVDKLDEDEPEYDEDPNQINSTTLMDHNDTQSGKESTDFQPIPLPNTFAAYDVINADGFITLEELTLVTGARENVNLAFKDSDINGDGKLTVEEFHNAPWYRLTASITAQEETATTSSL